MLVGREAYRQRCGHAQAENVLGIVADAWRVAGAPAVQDFKTIAQMPVDEIGRLGRNAGFFRDFAQASPTDFATALSVLQDASDTWREDGVPLWTLVGTASDGLDWLQDIE